MNTSMASSTIAISKQNRQVASEEIMGRLRSVQALAIDVGELVSARLYPICRAIPDSTQLCDGPPIREYPPMFSDMRDHLDMIESVLHRINDIMDRCELP